MQKVKALIPHLFTAGNLLGGILAIIFILEGHLEYAPFCIFASAILDFLDGFVARLLKVPSELGKQLDSLADMVTFGVAPGILIYKLIQTDFVLENLTQNYMPSSWKLFFPIDVSGYCNMHSMFISNSVCDQAFFKFWPFIGLIIPVFALFRLAKFNLDTRQSDSFIGIPTPAMTLFFTAIPLMLYYDPPFDLKAIDSLKFFLINPLFLTISAILFSILMVVELPLFALKFKSFGWKGNEIRYSFLTLSVVMLATLFFWAVPLIIILYIILSLINNMIKK